MPVENAEQYEPSPWEPIATQVDRYLATGGEEGAVLEGAPCVILETVGRKSGKLRRTPLIRVNDGDYMVVASLGGADQHPQWYPNLVDDPDVAVYDGPDRHLVRARTAPPEEKARRWAAATAVWPSYDDYQASTERDIPLVVLEPR
jgi:deazaflavin-dependent oxidoreductase (nitroreductase family)